MNRDRRNYPSTVAEAEEMLRHSAIGSYKIETCGERIVGRPLPLPHRFVAKLAAKIANDPVTWGRLLQHAKSSTPAGPNLTTSTKRPGGRTKGRGRRP